MDTQLSSFLADVWENRDVLLYGNPDPTGDDVEERVYAMYAPMHGVGNAGITKVAYDLLVNGINAPPNSGWVPSQRTWAYVWDNRSAASARAGYRVYINAKLTQATQIFQRIMAMSARAPAQANPPNALPVIPDHVLATSYMALANRGIYADVIAGMKIAFAAEAFNGRPDIIVVYISDAGGRQIAAHLARRIAAMGDWFRTDIPPMTERIAWGISIGPEVSGTQWGVATSFGQVRTTLIAWAMIEAVTGVATNGGRHDVPLQMARHGSPNRLTFFQLVTSKFAQYQIDANRPWAG
ncbi:MAG: T3SS effector HopA1 family protein [Bryobacteraceae bacterium]